MVIRAAGLEDDLDLYWPTDSWDRQTQSAFHRLHPRGGRGGSTARLLWARVAGGGVGGPQPAQLQDAGGPALQRRCEPESAWADLPKRSQDHSTLGASVAQPRRARIDTGAGRAAGHAQAQPRDPGLCAGALAGLGEVGPLWHRKTAAPGDPAGLRNQAFSGDAPSTAGRVKAGAILGRSTGQLWRNNRRGSPTVGSKCS